MADTPDDGPEDGAEDIPAAQHVEHAIASAHEMHIVLERLILPDLLYIKLCMELAPDSPEKVYGIPVIPMSARH